MAWVAETASFDQHAEHWMPIQYNQVDSAGGSIMTKRKRSDRFDATIEQLTTTVKAMDDCVSEDLVVHSLATISAYLSAVEAKSADLPVREDLGMACFLLLWDAMLTQDDMDRYEVVLELLTPEIGVDLIACADTVRDVRSAYLAELSSREKSVEVPQVSQRPTPVIDESDLPF